MLTNLFKKKVETVKKTDHDIFMEELFGSKNEEKRKYQSIFKYDSVNKYKSIHTYDKLNSNSTSVEVEYKRPGTIEIFFNYGIIGIFYFLFIIFLPFSLLVCVKKIKENERIIVYRLGRIIKPEYKPGYCICFPLIDSYKKISSAQKEFSLPNLQILNHENAIIDTTTIVRYEIFDPVKLLNTLEDLNMTLKSVARGYLVANVSNKDSNIVEREKNYIIQDFTNQMNEYIKKWGVKITNVDLAINNIEMEENKDGEDPALKTISMVFKSLLGGGNNSSSSTEPCTSGVKPDASLNQLPSQLMKFIEGLSQPMVIPNNSELAGSMFQGMFPNKQQQQQSTTINMEDNSEVDNKKMSPYKILKLLEPLINENLVKEIQTVYEFHILSTNGDNSVEVFYLDLKNNQKGMIGRGNAPFSKTDCVVRLSDEDLNELLTDNLKPFTAYMSGRIEIDGDLQDVFKLKKLITSVSTVIAQMK